MAMETLMDVKTAPVARTGMLIRKPAAEVCEAFVDPAVTSRFWFSKGSGPLTMTTAKQRSSLPLIRRRSL